MTKQQLIFVALDYLNKNPYRFNSQEKAKFLNGLTEWANGKMSEIDDEIYDFLIDVGIYKGKRREEEFVSYLNQKYGIIRFKKILDVGAGRMCKLSEALAKFGNSMYAIDPNIRLSQQEANRIGIKSIKLQKFVCDEFAKNGKGTNIQSYDYIIGLEPCDATEHIIRQGIKYEKPFDILLCGAPHKALNGSTFDDYEEWYEYLSSISTEVKISKFASNYVASNTNFQKNENEIEK